MLIRFGVRNHLSIYGSESITLTRSSLSGPEEGLIESPARGSSDLLPAIILYGANASGKSNLVSAMRTMQEHVVKSHSLGKPGGGVPRSPFALKKSAREETSSFEIDFFLDEIRYHFGYNTDGSTFVSEWLYSFPAGRRQRLYERTEQNFLFGRALRGQNRIIADLTRPNSLFVSAAAQNGHEELLRVFSYIKDIEIANQISVPPFAASQNFEDGIVDQRIILFLESLNTGIVRYRKQERDASPEAILIKQGIIDLVRKVTNSDVSVEAFEETTNVSIQLGHETEENEVEFFDLERESAGTRRLLFVLKPIFAAIDKGKPVVVDELDASLHTQAVEALIALFMDKRSNPLGGQLVATVHDTNLLRSTYLRRDQIWFAEKNRTGATQFFPLSDVHTRRSDNIEKGYLEGRYGAVPLGGPISDIVDKF